MAGLLGLLGLTRAVDAAEVACAAGDVTCLIEAINVANTNGEANTITLEAGTYTLTAVDHDSDGPTGLPSVTSPLTLRGAGAASTVLEREAGAPPFRLLHVASTGTLALDGLTLQGGNLVDLSVGGGGVRNDGTLAITHSTLSGNTAGTGGAIASLASFTVTDSTLSNNMADAGGVIWIGTFSGGTIHNSTLSGNTASGGDG